MRLGAAGAGIVMPGWLRNRNLLGRAFNYDIGFQSWVVREQIAENFTGTMRKMASLGYETVELCSPVGYASLGFGDLQKHSATELKGIMNDAGITCTSCHYGFSELKDNGQERIDFARELGLSQMIVSSFGLNNEASLDDWKKAADEMNEVGALGAKSGVQMGFHNHNGEFEELDGQLIYDVLLERLDPELVKMQFQVWVVSIGFKAADYFREHPGRFISAHLSDWSGEGEERVAIGQGKVDWADFFEAAENGGLKNVYVEMDPSLLPESAAYLKGLG
jgi:sugar phosphate isomerase/epimerase